MDKLRMVLANGDEIAMSEFGVPMHALIHRASNDEILNIWKKMTVENLAHVKIKTSEGTIMNFRKVQLSGVQAIDDHDGAYTAHFYIFAYFCFTHQAELREELFKKLEAELQET